MTTDTAATAAILGVAALVALVLTRRAAQATRRALRGRRPEEVLTVVAAVIATTVQADGSWIVFRNIVHAPVFLRTVTFAFIEIAVFACALRARRNVLETGSAGVDGIAVWVLTSLSAVFASLAAGSVRGVLFRLLAPMVAAWLWERSMAGERRRARLGRSIHWRITPERILVRLGLADAALRTADDVDAHRRLYRVARRAKQVRAGGWRKRWAQRRLDRALGAAVEHAALATDPARQAALMAQLAVLFHGAALAELEPEAPWFVPVEVPRLRLVRASEVRGEVGDDVPEDVPDEADEQADRSVGDGAGGDQEQADDERPDDVPADVPEIDPEELARLVRRARRKFGKELAAGTTPGIRKLMPALRIGQDKATAVKAALTASGTEGAA